MSDSRGLLLLLLVHTLTPDARLRLRLGSQISRTYACELCPPPPEGALRCALDIVHVAWAVRRWRANLHKVEPRRAYRNSWRAARRARRTDETPVL